MSIEERLDIIQLKTDLTTKLISNLKGELGQKVSYEYLDDRLESTDAYNSSEYATKDDIRGLRKEIDILRKKLYAANGEINKLEIKARKEKVHFIKDIVYIATEVASQICAQVLEEFLGEAIKVESIKIAEREDNEQN